MAGQVRYWRTQIRSLVRPRYSLAALDCTDRLVLSVPVPAEDFVTTAAARPIYTLSFRASYTRRFRPGLPPSARNRPSPTAPAERAVQDASQMRACRAAELGIADAPPPPRDLRRRYIQARVQR